MRAGTSIELLHTRAIGKIVGKPRLLGMRKPGRDIYCVFALLDRTKSECAALLDLVRRNLELVAVGIAEINRVRDFVILEFKFDSALL